MIKMFRKWKKVVAMALTAGVLLSTAATPVSAATAGWRKDSTGWWYQYANGSYAANKWEKINGAWYYFDGRGYMLENSWKKDTDGKWYYLGASGAMQTNTWIKEYDTNYENSYIWDWNHARDCYDWYYVGADGVMKTNAWVQDKAGLWYYLTADGSMKEGGFIQYAGKEYYVDDNGVMQTGVIEDDFDIYYFGEDGAKQTGYVNINGTEYYFSEYGYIGTAKLVSENKRFEEGIPYLGIGYSDGDGTCRLHLKCQKGNCNEGKLIDFVVPDGEYFSVQQYFYDYANTLSIYGEREAHVFYREGNYLDAYNYCLNKWDVSSKGTISTSIGTMEYVVDDSGDWTYIAGFVQVDSKHYVRLLYCNCETLSEKELISDFTKVAQWLKSAQ